jgi:hypothetical protein
MSKFTNVASLMFEVEKLQMERDQLKAERDAFLAELQKANAIILDLQRNPPKFTEQHLSEIRAEAGRAGYLQALYDYEQIFEIDCNMTPENAADQYAERIRQGGAK